LIRKLQHYEITSLLQKQTLTQDDKVFEASNNRFKQQDLKFKDLNNLEEETPKV